MTRLDSQQSCRDPYCRSHRPGGYCDCPPPMQAQAEALGLVIPSNEVVQAVLEEAEREGMDVALGGAYRLAYAALNAAAMTGTQEPPR